jgi:hypothetical protein
MKCFDNVKNFCQFRKELISNQSILYQVYNSGDVVYCENRKEENFVDISQAVKIKLEVAENEFNNTHDLSFESDGMQDDTDPSNPYQFKNESQGTEFAIYSESMGKIL